MGYHIHITAASRFREVCSVITLKNLDPKGISPHQKWILLLKQCFRLSTHNKKINDFKLT